MKTEVIEVQANQPITILKLVGELDASCYMDIISQVHSLYRGGCRNLLLDLSEMSFMASSGLVALHSIALIMRGEEPPDASAGWQTMQAMTADFSDTATHEPHCKLLAPQPRVVKTLKMTGFEHIFEQFTDRETAVNSFTS